MGRDVASNGFTIVIVLVVLLAMLAGWTRNAFVDEGPLQAGIFFDVEQGASLTQVSENLADAGAVSSALLFRLNTRFQDRARELRFGTYEIPAGASMDAVLDIVTSGAPSLPRFRAIYVLRNAGTGQLRLEEREAGADGYAEIARFAYEDGVPDAYETARETGDVGYSVVIPEGLTSWQIVEGLNQADFLSGEVAELPAEGSLAPASYEVRRGADRAGLLIEMAEIQAATLAEAWENRASGLPLASPEEALVLASIIEKETGVSSERELVASVFVNRLNLGMRLQTDPTVIYGVTEGRGVLGRGLRQSELDAVTPWNTYQIDGLPPTPIANPGRASIEAALNPGSSEFIFFVADGTGGHAFAVTLAEHNANVARWREIERQRQDDG